MKKHLLLIAMGTAMGTQAFGHDFMPENNLHLYDNVNFTSGITEEQFNEVIDEAEAYYASIIDNHGGELKIERKWSNATVNASAMQMGGTWYVNMYGGLARRKEVTKDGFALVLCHELGHHLGGFPYTSSWAANEGQSDYFATLTCARELWKDDAEANAEAERTVEEYPKQLCDSKWQDTTDRQVCYRSMMGGWSLADLLNQLGGGGAISWENKDPKEVTRTNNAHPAAQCRLDTYVAGAACVAQFDANSIPKTEKDSSAVSCLQSAGDNEGARPRCWFKPTL